MASPITAISLNGVALDLTTVEYNVSVQHGRSDVTSAPQASSCQITIRGPVGVAAEITDTLLIEAYDVPRFTGEISDITITHLSANPPVAITTIIGMGNLSKISQTTVGVDGWTSETVRARVEEILTATGLTFANAADPDIILHSLSAAHAEPTDAYQALSALAVETGATFYDDPEGRIVFESYGSRGLTTLAGIWANQTDDWATYTQTWASFTTEPITWVTPPDGVIFTPQWSRTRSTIVNDVTVTGHASSSGEHGASWEANQTDSASIAAYGRREYRLDTHIKFVADGETRAGNIITAQANPLWSLGQISVYMDQLGNGDLDAALALVSGRSLAVIDLPLPAPLGQFLGIVEGWGETYANEQHILTVSVSDPRYSFQTITWAEVDPALQWAGINPDLKWYEIISGSNLAA